MRIVHPADTACEMTWIVMPGHTNALGTCFGGQVLAWIDICAAVSSQRFCRGDVVTASIDSVSFNSPIRVGEVAVLRASVNRGWRTSMEVGVKVEAEDRYTGERRHTSTAYLTFVALAASGVKITVPTLQPVSELDTKRYDEAGRRRDLRLKHRGLV